jgi:hypothetical protein
MMIRWGKVCIANGGDRIRAQCAVSPAQAQTCRDASYIRVSESAIIVHKTYQLIFLFKYTLLVVNNQRGRGPAQIRQVFYGQLESILDIALPQDAQTLRIPASKHHLLAVVIPCSTCGRDATKELTTYTETTAPIVIDLRAVECVVGRVKRGNEWSVIDRSGDFARTVFTDADVSED